MSKKFNVIDFQSKARESEKQALDRLYDEHHIALRRFLCSRMKVGQDIDDVVQEVFAKLAKVHQLSQRLPIGVEGNLSYIFKIANNLVINIERHKSIRKRYLDNERAQLLEEDTFTEHNPERISLAKQELNKVREAIFGMRHNWRQAFILNRFKQKTYSEIAVYMGVSVKQVEKYMKQALIVVRNTLKEIQENEK